MPRRGKKLENQKMTFLRKSRAESELAELEIARISTVSVEAS
jgi:hypothetical protein